MNRLFYFKNLKKNYQQNAQKVRNFELNKTERHSVYSRERMREDPSA